MFSGVKNAIGSISQNKQQIIDQTKNINNTKNTRKYKLFVTLLKLNKNGSFFLHKKQCFYGFVQLATTTRCKKTVYNVV